LETQAIVNQNPQAAVEEKREAIERIWRFYVDWAAEAPGTGKLEQASAWRKKLTEFDDASSPAKPATK